jgi:hypothetical protein
MKPYCCRGKTISIKEILVCVCMLVLRACVRACRYPGTWKCASAYVHITLLIQQATRMRHIVTSLVAPLPPLNFFDTVS